MDPECRNISKLILPAVRASVAEIMKDEYNYRQSEIAERLGVVQVSVSKYLNRKYSPDIAKMKTRILERGLGREIVDEIVKGRSSEEVGRKIDELCGRIAQDKGRIVDF
jgi:predicted transcriptional regulator